LDLNEEKPSSITPAGLLAVAYRRRWLMLVSFLFGWGILAGAAWMLPSRYRSETLIMVEQQKVPEHYVVSNVASDLQNRLQSMSEQILSRTRLESIITSLNLYQKERVHTDLDSLIERMRGDINIELVRTPGAAQPLSAFKVSFSARDPRVAQQVTSALTSLFIEENLRTREEQSEKTTAFLNDQLKDAGGRLAEDDRKLREFKSQYLGQLPEQLQSNLQILQGLQTRMQASTDDLNRAQQQKLYLQSLLGQYKTAPTALPLAPRPEAAPAGPAQPAVAKLQPDEKLELMKATLADDLQKYTPEHPDVIRLKKEIAAAEAKQAEQQRSGADPTVAKQKPAIVIDPLAQLDSQLQATQLEIANRQAETKRIQAEIDQYQSRLNLTPMREQQLTGLTRDYEQQKANYDSLLAKKLQSETATDLEKRQEGEQFRMIDPPSLPQKPYSPNRLALCLAGLVAGVALAAGFAFGLELLDPKVNTKHELGLALPIPILASIPNLRTAEEQQSFRRRLVLEGIAAAVLLMVVPAVTAITYLRG
jgi:succinoglycan biosynthesis transport protein ExoP